MHSLPLTVVLVLGEGTKEKAALGVFLASLDLEALEMKGKLSTALSFFCLQLAQNDILSWDALNHGNDVV